MSCASEIYVVSSNVDVEEGGTIPINTIVRRYGRCLGVQGNAVAASCRGYYDVDCTVTLTAATTGTIGIQLMKDGVAVPGASMSQTVTAGSQVGLSFHPAVRNKSCDTSALSVVVTGSAATDVDYALRVRKS